MNKNNNDRGAKRRMDILRRRTSARQSPPIIETAPLTRYVTDGKPAEAPKGASVADGLRFAEQAPNHMTMSLFPAPTESAIREISEAWELHPMIVEDLFHAQQRPKLDRYGDVLFLAVRSARYLDELEEVDFSEFHMLIKPRSIIVLCQDKRWIDGTNGLDFDEEELLSVDRREHTLLADETLLKFGPTAVVYRLLDAIVDGFSPVLQGISLDKEQIERQVFSGDAAVAERIYRLSQEIIDMQHTTTSLAEVVQALQTEFIKIGVPHELQAYLDDVSDHLTRTNLKVAEYRDSLSQILNVNSTLVAQRQNEDMKKISGWAAILFAPTLIGAVYGMNFDNMPELHWSFGYPMALAMMVALAVLLYVIFKRNKWM